MSVCYYLVNFLTFNFFILFLLYLFIHLLFVNKLSIFFVSVVSEFISVNETKMKNKKHEI